MNFTIKIFLLVFCLFSNIISAHAKDLRVMVFAAHPDDEVIGCGGSIKKHIDLNNNVHVVYMTSGDAGSLKYTKKELAEIRELEAQKGLEILGLKNQNSRNSSFLRNKDGYLESNAENLIKIVEIIREYKPDIVYLPHSEEFHQDHRITFDLVTKAINKARGNWFQEAKGKPWTTKTILLYEIYPFQKNVNYCEDISDYINFKYLAIKAHESQIESVRYDDLIESIGRYRGILSNGSEYAECFQIMKIENIFK